MQFFYIMLCLFEVYILAWEFLSSNMAPFCSCIMLRSEMFFVLELHGIWGHAFRICGTFIDNKENFLDNLGPDFENCFMF